MRDTSMALKGISALLLDMDGVLYSGDRTIDGAADAVERFRSEGKKLLFITNNSASTREKYARKLARMGIRTSVRSIITSGYATAVYLKEHSPGARIHVVGGKGLKFELRRAGLTLVSGEEVETATHVVAGLDQKIKYDKIADGLRALLAGAEFVATNLDPTYPSEKGLLPGAGAIVGALRGCSGREPDVVIGKPSPHIINMAMSFLRTNPGETAIIGDRIDTDIEAGRRAGLRTILVLSGACTEEDLRRAKNAGASPDFVFESITEVTG
ncbi:MAG: hypothetical protein DRN83_02755 [Hadesarchaea archaeon]|nr:MAG: hypothetical protein DRN83_02755 [Hadesarchaea archaeon]